MDETTKDALAAEIDQLLASEDLTIPGIAGRLQQYGTRSEDLGELIALINQRKHR